MCNTHDAPADTVTAHVDHDVCVGHARCVGVAPELFEIDDYGQAVAVERALTGGDAVLAREAAEACPEQAIAVTLRTLPT